MIDVSRDARWGRCSESPGEDTALCAAFGAAMIEGYQQDDLTRHDTVMATAKHFVGYGASQGGLNWAPAFVPPRELREVQLHPFEAAVRVGGTLRNVPPAFVYRISRKR